MPLAPGLAGQRHRGADVQGPGRSAMSAGDRTRRRTGAQGWADQRWTLDRVAVLITRLFGVDYTPKGISLLLHRLGWSPQVSAHRAVERDEEAIATWVKETWPRIKGGRRSGTGGSVSPARPA